MVARNGPLSVAEPPTSAPEHNVHPTPVRTTTPYTRIARQDVEQIEQIPPPCSCTWRYATRGPPIPGRRGTSRGVGEGSKPLVTGNMDTGRKRSLERRLLKSTVNVHQRLRHFTKRRVASHTVNDRVHSVLPGGRNPAQFV